MDNKFLLGVVLAVTSVFGYVVLALSGNDRLEAARGVFLFTTPFVAILLGASAFEKINERTKTIESQTNGHLTKRIQDTADAAAEAAVKRVLESSGGRDSTHSSTD